MMIRVTGEHPLRDAVQALMEQIKEAEDMGVRYTRGATLYLNPTNGFGEDVQPHKHGRKIEKLHSKGPYKSAADHFVP